MKQKKKNEKKDAVERTRLQRLLDHFGKLRDLDVLDAKLSQF